MSRKAWIPIKRSTVKAKSIIPVPGQWLLKSKEDPDSLIRLKSINVVKGYMQVSVVDYTDSFSPVATYISTSIMIVLTLYREEEG